MAATVESMTFPAGTCGTESRCSYNTVPWLEADHDGADDAVVSFVCFGSPFAQCCAGRMSALTFVGVFDFSTPAQPRPIGATIIPGTSPVHGESFGEPRRIDRVRVEDLAIITDEKLIYPDTSGVTPDLGYSPEATIEVTHTFADGAWSSTERVVG